MELRVAVPEGVVRIGDDAFLKDADLESIELPSGLKSIGKSAFEDCDLSSIKLPSDLTTIEDYAFLRCSNLESIEIPSSVCRDSGRCNWYREWCI